MTKWKLLGLTFDQVVAEDLIVIRWSAVHQQLHAFAAAIRVTWLGYATLDGSYALRWFQARSLSSRKSMRWQFRERDNIVHA